jgi:hypothetical protein
MDCPAPALAGAQDVHADRLAREQTGGCGDPLRMSAWRPFRQEARIERHETK